MMKKHQEVFTTIYLYSWILYLHITIDSFFINVITHSTIDLKTAT